MGRKTWRLKRVRLEMLGSNIFNKTEYRETTYNSIGNSTSYYILRPCEQKVQAAFQL